MTYPSAARIELPILEELIATGGREDVRFLYERLVAYFPQLEEGEIRAIANGHRSQWRRLVQRAGRALNDQRQIERRRGFWTITGLGRKRATDEGQSFSPTEASDTTRRTTTYVRDRANTAGQPVTWTAVPYGSGTRIAGDLQ